MRIAVVTDSENKAAWLAGGLQEGAEVVWQDQPAIVTGVDVYIDLLYSIVPQRVEEWAFATDSLIIINDVLKNNATLPAHYIRMNGWPTFLHRPLTELACRDEALKEKAEAALAVFNRTAEWVPDVPGFVSARVISTIINEAYFSLEEQVSTKEEIDIAMKLGTNYPYGPFEWAQKIGLQNICQLLDGLAVANARYLPATLLKKEALL
ncbi:MAG: hypothetical protein JNM19_17990 [Chitinophagaceae bacterium]|nr:hypothetical protein [Chitinophagaceae bacterium]